MLKHQSKDNFQAPNLQRVAWLRKCYHRYFQPKFFHSERANLAQRPALLVGNHTLTGILDSPFLLEYFLMTQNVAVRSLGDKIHFYIPLWGRALQWGGMLLASRSNAAKLMQQGNSVLVFPGGAREVMRRKGEKYQLLWKDRAGFARLAIEQGYDIIPFAALGADDCYDIHLDANQYMQWPIVKWILKWPWLQNISRNGDIFPSLFTGVAFTPLPKPQKFYFAFAERIATEQLPSSTQHIHELRDATAQAIESQLNQLKQYREQDLAQWSRLRRWMTLSSIKRT